MFGQQQSVFGAPAAQPSAFGGFGASSTFGAAPAGGGLFGQTQPAQPSFGGTSAFGGAAFGQQPSQPANPFSSTGSTGFGAAANPFGGQQTAQPAQSSGLFGNTGLFGAQPQQPGQTTFGQPQQPAATGLFGAASAGGGLFGQSKSGFGTSTSFGAQPAATNSLFGTQQSMSTASGSLFGGTNTGSTGTGLFGQQSSTNLFGGMTQSQSGTTVKFVPVMGSDAAIKNGQQSSVTTKNYCICTMKEYNEQKSQEELRLEDYQANRKYGAAAPASTGLFGANTQPSQPSGTGLFGSNTTSGFGGTSAFGQNNAAKPGGFGTTSGGLFGQPSQPAASGGFFGAPAAAAAPAFGQSSMFSQPAATTAPSLFGGFGGLGAPATTTASSTLGSFGSSFGGFGQTAAPASTGGLFGQQPAPAATASPFGTFNTGGGLFGAAAKPAAPTSAFGGFGTAAVQPTGFSGFPSLTSTQPAAGTGGMFGLAKPAFGAAATTSTPFGGFGTSTGFSGFGAAATTQPGTSLFGQPAAASTGLFGAQSQPASSSFFGAGQSAQQGLSAQSSSGGNIHAQVVEMLRQGVSDTEVLSNMYAQLPIKNVEKKKAPLSGATINEFIDNAKRNYAPAVGASRKDERTYNYYVAPTHKVDGLSLAAGNGLISWRPAAAKRDEKFKLDRACIEKLESEINKSRTSTPHPAVGPAKVTQIKSCIYTSSYSPQQQLLAGKSDRFRASSKLTPPVQVFNVRKAFDQAQDDSVTDAGSQDDDRASSGSGGDEQSLASGDDDDENGRRGGQEVLTLNRRDYYTIPDKSELELDERGQCIVEGFFVGRYQCGGVRFEGKTDVAGMNLDALVSISDNEVAVYYQDERKKPPVGKGLNKRAVITFENIRPSSADGRQPTKRQIEDSDFEQILRARIEAMDPEAEFLSYNVENSQLSFLVKHFSKYRLVLTREDVTIRLAAPWTGGKNSNGTADVEEDWLQLSQNVSKGSEDSSKENQSPLVPGKRKRFAEDDDDDDTMTKSPRNNQDDSIGSPDRLPVSPLTRRRLDIGTEERLRRESVTSADTSGDVTNYFDRLPDQSGGSLAAVPAFLQMKQPVAVGKKTRRVVLEFGQAGKSVVGALAMGSPAGVLGFLASPQGQFLSPFAIQHDVALTDDSKTYMEEMLQFYLSNCDFENEKGEHIISPPDSAKLPKFIEEFCSLAQNHATAPVHEQIVWSLFCALYGEPDLPEVELAEKFLTWLKDTVALIQPVYTKLEDIPADSASKAVFEAVLGGRNQTAVEIALHFGLTDAASTILALWDPCDEQPEVRAEVADSIGPYIDQVMMERNVSESSGYWTKTLMILTGTVFVTGGTVVDTFSVCQDLDWLQCMAVCALHLPQNGRLSGIWDILHKYTAHAESDPHCSLPGPAGGPPRFILSMLTHYCRHSMPSMTSSLDADLLAEAQFDVRVKWFVMQLYGVTGDGFGKTVQLSVTSQFAKSLQISGYPHVSVIALLHLHPDQARRNEVRNVLMSLVRMAKEQPSVCDSLMKFLTDDLKIPVQDIEHVKATLALSEGDQLDALAHFYAAGTVSKCHDILRTDVIPLLASAAPAAFTETLEKLAFLGRQDTLLPRFSAFFQLLRIVEECSRNDQQLSEEQRDVLDEILGLVGDSGDLFADSRPRGDGPLDGFIRHKLRQGRALLLAAN